MSLKSDIDVILEVLEKYLPRRNTLDNIALATAIGTRLQRRVIYVDTGKVEKKAVEKQIRGLISRWSKK